LSTDNAVSQVGRAGTRDGNAGSGDGDREVLAEKLMTRKAVRIVGVASTPRLARGDSAAGKVGYGGTAEFVAGHRIRSDFGRGLRQREKEREQGKGGNARGGIGFDWTIFQANVLHNFPPAD